VAIPQKKLLSYYTENPRYLHYYARIHKPLEDVIIKIAKQRDQPGEALEAVILKVRLGFKNKAKTNPKYNFKT
jgi:hypothetical protein